MEQKIITDFPSLNFGEKKLYNRQLFSEIDALKGHQNPSSSNFHNRNVLQVANKIWKVFVIHIPHFHLIQKAWRSHGEVFVAAYPSGI